MRAFLSRLGGFGLGTRYQREVRREAGLRPRAVSPVSEADLAPLPRAVRRYLIRAGVVGRPRVRSFRARFRGLIRSAPDGPWMKATVEQHGFFGPVARFFFMKAKRGSLPFRVFHRYVGDAATMEVRMLGVVPVLDVAGPELTQSETVTVLNDMFVLAPAALLDADIEWVELADGRVRAIWQNAGHRVTGVATFDERGDLVLFQSDDRYQSDRDTHRLFRWSTPVGGYRDFGGVRLAADGEARWQEPEGEWTYARFTLEEIAYDVASEAPGSAPGVAREGSRAPGVRPPSHRRASGPGQPSPRPPAPGGSA